MKIQVLGSGCPNCKRLNEMVIRAVNELGIKAEVEYISGDKGISRIIEMGIMSSPVITVNGKPVMIGFTPDTEKIKTIIQKAK